MNNNQPQDVYPLTVFFDGQCPLCRREIAHYKKIDRFNHLQPQDIAAPDFRAADFGLDEKRVNEVMHARTANGTLYTEVAAFRAIWRAMPPTLLTRLPEYFLRLPGMMIPATWAYRLFAKNRYRLTGRCTPESCAITPTNAPRG